METWHQGNFVLIWSSRIYIAIITFSLHVLQTSMFLVCVLNRKMTQNDPHTAFFLSPNLKTTQKQCINRDVGLHHLSPPSNSCLFLFPATMSLCQNCSDVSCKRAAFSLPRNTNQFHFPLGTQNFNSITFTSHEALWIGYLSWKHNGIRPQPEQGDLTGKRSSWVIPEGILLIPQMSPVCMTTQQGKQRE